MSKNKCFVDLAMLDRFTIYHRRRLKIYSDMIDAIWHAYRTFVYNDIVGTGGSLEAAANKVDEIAAILAEDDPYVATGKEYFLVNDFLNGLRHGLDGNPIKRWGDDFLNDHDWVESAISRVASDWRELRKTYRHTATTNTQAFRKQILDELPDVNALYALLAAEYAKAREILLAQPEMLQ